MNLFWREMKASRKSLIIWVVGIVAMVGAGMGKFAGLSGSGEAMSALMSDLPEGLQAVMGLGGLDISTVTGYYGMLYLYLIIMGAVHASMLGANALAKEERDKTAEFLLVKPISRMKILLIKLAAVVMQTIIFNVVMTGSSIAFVAPYADGGASAVVGDIVRLMLGMLLVQLLFASVGMAIAASGRNPKRAGALSAGIMLLTFFLSVAIDLSGGIDALSFLTPYKYFAATDVLSDGLNPTYIALSIGIMLAAVAITITGYRRRDMRV